jgi:hypothetical protein
MADKKLAYTVHHKGRKYRAGSTAEEIGPAAGDFGDHVWEGGKAPARSAVPGPSAPAGGVTLGSRTVPPPSGLPGNLGGEDPVVEHLRLGSADAPASTGGGDTGTAGADATEASAADSTTTRTAAKKAAPAKKAAGN